MKVLCQTSTALPQAQACFTQLICRRNRTQVCQLISTRQQALSLRPNRRFDTFRNRKLYQDPARRSVVVAGTKGFGVGYSTQATVAKPEAATPAMDEKLVKLRQLFADSGIHAFIVPSEDPHMSEYSPECYKRREYISKFTGSAGTVVVTEDKALLWTDGRYFFQAEQELGPDWTLMKAGTPNCPNIEDWLAAMLPEGGKVGIDPFVHTVDSFRRLERKLSSTGRSVVLLADGNPVDKVWGAEQPAPPTAQLRVHPAEWAGEKVSEKVERIRKDMTSAGADALVVTMLDEVAWLFNLRGKDVSYNPVFLSYAIITTSGALLYVDLSKLTPEVLAHLQEGGVQVKPYDTLLGDVRLLASSGASIWMDPTKVSTAIYQAAKDSAEGRGKKRAREEEGDGAQVNGSSATTKQPIMEYASPITSAKALKNPLELAGMREAHLRDAVAICQFLHWLEQQVASGRSVSEVEIDHELTGRRAQQQGFVEPSFPTIAGAGPNGAIIHYRAQEKSCRSVDSNTMLLLDSGCQYDCGTTDITRTMHFGTPSDHQKKCYTRVLQGHIMLDQAVFPEGTAGCQLDTLARVPLWREGLNYRHGTGHGVGAALNVHEGPQSISSRLNITTALQPTMICSNEPGYYEDGAFGIRIENLVVVKEMDTPFRFGGQPYYGFEPLTMVPIQTKLIALSLMTDSDIQWLNNYHKKVWELVSPRLQGMPEVLKWLEVNTQPVSKAA